MPFASRAPGPTVSHGTSLCRFHRDICDSIVQVRHAQNRFGRPVQDQPGQNAAQLRNGVSQGCYVCVTFWSCATQSYRNGVERNNLQPPHNQDGVVNSYSYSILKCTRAHLVDIETIEMFVYYDSRAPARLPSGRKITAGRKAEYAQGFMILPASDVCAPDGVECGDSTEPEATGEHINEWSQRCRLTHDKCKKPPARRGTFPSRLVAVEHNKIKVKYTAKIDRSEEYVALSYCWGTDKTVKLTDSVNDPLYSGIPLSTLPQTLIDAILATRAMGKKYIWIDSLCMAQVPRSNDDWTSEAPHMGEIYANAWCTIAATHGTDNEAGCFVERDPRLIQLPTYNSPVHANLHNDQEQFYIADVALWDYAITNAPLYKRRWVLQERLLSPRTVHFCTEQVFWECVELVACESFPGGIPEKLITYHPGGGQWMPQNQLKVYLNETPRTSSDAYDQWNTIVEEYSRLDPLSEETDKLVALAGIAQRLQPTIDDQPVAGLWFDHLPLGLAWSRTGHILGTRPGGPYVAPSWSWASLEGGIKFLEQSERWVTMTNVMDCTTSPKNSPFGPLKSATLTLRGPLLDLTVIQDYQQTLPGQPHPGWIKLGRIRLLADIVTWDVRPLAQFVGVQLYFTPLLFGNGLAARGADMVVGLVLEPFNGKMMRVGLLCTGLGAGDQILDQAERFSSEIVVV